MAVSAAGATVSGTTSTTTASVAVAFNQYSGYLAQVANKGPDVLMVRGGTGTQTAVVTDLPVLPGTFRDVAFPAGTDEVGIISPTSTADYFITPITGS